MFKYYFRAFSECFKNYSELMKITNDYFNMIVDNFIGITECFNMNSEHFNKVTEKFKMSSEHFKMVTEYFNKASDAFTAVLKKIKILENL